MKGHVRKRGSTWYVVVELPRTTDGARRQKWIPAGPTKKAAQRECARIVDELHNGSYVEPTDLSLAEFLTKWLASHQTNIGSGKTYHRYEDICLKYIAPRLGHTPLAKLSPLEIQEYYAWEMRHGRRRGEGGLSAQTVKHHHAVLKKALAQAVKWRLIPLNPADAVEPPRPAQQEMKTLDRAGVDTLLEELRGRRLYAPVVVALTTGARRGEILGLKWRDLDLDKATLTIRRSLEQTRDGLRLKDPKTKKSRRTIALPDMTVKVLNAHRIGQALRRLAAGDVYEDNDLVFPNPSGGFWKPNSFSSSFAATAKRLDLPVRLHDLRHTHATMLLEQGVHPKVVSERLGHSSVTITLDTYSHVLPNIQEAAAQAIEVALGDENRVAN